MALRRSLSVLAAASALAVGVAAPRAHAAIVERVVAVVGEKPILLSELRQRARPFLLRIAATTQNPSQRAAAESEMFKELLDRMVDDRLEDQAADKARITVTPEEIDNGIKNVATQAKIAPADLVREAAKQGLSEQDYRDEIRRQILEGKLVQLRVRGRVRVTDDEARVTYGRWKREMAQEQAVELRILALRTPSDTPEHVAVAKQALAVELVQRARAGEDFCKLVEAYSDDSSTKLTCGSRGPQPVAQLLPELQGVARELKAGQVEGPIRYGEEAMLIVQMAQTPTIPPYEQVKEAMRDRAFGEAMEHQRKVWLREMRRGVYVEIRL